MNRFRRAAAFIIIAELLIIGVMNWIYLSWEKRQGRFYRVEAERIDMFLEESDALRAAPEDIDLSQFDSIIRVSEYDPSETVNNDYLVEEAGGKLFRIEYKVEDSSRAYISMNIGMAAGLLVTVLVLIYIGRKVIRPFDKMTGLTEELAKGNLSTPIKQEKSRFFGRFIWGMDMLRENLEDSKAKNLEYQKEKKTLLMSLSHDIKTPLSAIQLYTKALSENVYETEEERTKALEGIRAKTDEIRGYVDKIYSLSREEFMEFDVHAGEAYLKDVMDGITAYYMDKLSVIHTEFVVDDYDNILLSCDKDRLVEAIQNLMENAIKYGDGKLIRISFADEEDCRLIIVENSGCSLEEAELNNIFDSFYRGSNIENIPGSGLGLYIVKQLMKRMDGDAFAEVDGGSFKVTLVVRKA